MLQVRTLRKLLLAGEPSAAGLDHLSAASGLVRIGQHLYVVADDENSLCVFDLSNDEPGTLIRIFEGDLPSRHAERKAAKADLEALTALPAFDGFPFGALMAIGSGSTARRYGAALIALDAQGRVEGSITRIDLASLLTPLEQHLPALNIEGAFVTGASLCLLQRGNKKARINACISFEWHDVERWLRASGPAPLASSITRFDLGSIDGVPLSFTDGAALPDGGWVFSAAAENTSDRYADGLCLGSAIGIVGADGHLRTIERLPLVCKVEGIAATVDGDDMQVLLVTDADDRRAPALLLATTLSAARTPAAKR